MGEFESKMRASAKAIAPGKIILFGEHFVVYGFPSIIATIERFFTVTTSYIPEGPGEVIIESSLGFTATKRNQEIRFGPSSYPGYQELVDKLYKIINYINGINIVQRDPEKGSLIVKLDSQLPLGGGLGSSSAFCVALSASFSRCKNEKFDKNKICANSINAEKLINRETSGADCTFSTFGGLGYFDKKNGYNRILSDTSNLEFLVVDTGKAHDTFSMVQRVSRFRDNNPKVFDKLCDSYIEIYQKGLKYIQEANWEALGSLLSENHSLLTKLSLSNNLIEKIVKVCNSYGAFGTKITGAGGGGCIISLIDRRDEQAFNNLTEKLSELNLKYFMTAIDRTGIKIV